MTISPQRKDSVGARAHEAYDLRACCGNELLCTASITAPHGAVDTRNPHGVAITVDQRNSMPGSDVGRDW